MYICTMDIILYVLQICDVLSDDGVANGRIKINKVVQKILKVKVNDLIR